MSAGERAGKAAAAAPDHRSLSAAADSHDAVEVFLGFRVEDRDPIGEGICQAGPYGDHTFGAQFCRDIGAGGAPRTISASGELSPALRSALLVRERGRHDAVAPEAEPEASGEFARPGASHQAIDLLVGNGAVMQQRGEPVDDLSRLRTRVFPRSAVDGETLRYDGRQAIRPADFNRAAKADEFGRSVQRSREVVSQKAQRWHDIPGHERCDNAAKLIAANALSRSLPPRS
jgi:hypothetical protein